MRVFQPERNPKVYTSNVFLVLGDWSGMGDVNTLIDAGTDPAVFDFIQGCPTGVGKREVDQLILTHCHSDHAQMAPAIRQRYGARVLAWEASTEGVTTPLVDGQQLTIGDRTFEVLHTPGHSSDSICLYCEEERVLFSGDTPLVINTSDGTYEPYFLEALERLCAKRIDTIHFGHGPSMNTGCDARLALTLQHVRQSRLRHQAAADNTSLAGLTSAR